MNELLEMRNFAWHALQRQLAEHYGVAPQPLLSLSPALRTNTWLSRRRSGVKAYPQRDVRFP